MSIKWTKRTRYWCVGVLKGKYTNDRSVKVDIRGRLETVTRKRLTVSGDSGKRLVGILRLLILGDLRRESVNGYPQSLIYGVDEVGNQPN